jgi:PIN domain nuclease of toxin-antitoxin system
VRLLLDTHIFLWATIDSPKLANEARRLILSAEEVYVSAASIWEIAIKSGLGKIEGDVGLMVGAIEGSGFLELPVSASHAAFVATLPLHHRDPFDRLIVAQAMMEPLALLTADDVLSQYTELVRVV